MNSRRNRPAPPRSVPRWTRSTPSGHPGTDAAVHRCPTAHPRPATTRTMPTTAVQMRLTARAALETKRIRTDRGDSYDYDRLFTCRYCCRMLSSPVFQCRRCGSRGRINGALICTVA